MTDRKDSHLVPARLRGYGTIFRCAARLVHYDGTVYPALYAIQGRSFSFFNQTFGHDTSFYHADPSDMCLALCFAGAMIDEEFGDEGVDD